MKTIYMTAAQWKATPRDLRIYRRRTCKRFLMRHTSHGICLLAVQIAAR